MGACASRTRDRCRNSGIGCFPMTPRRLPAQVPGRCAQRSATLVDHALRLASTREPNVAARSKRADAEARAERAAAEARGSASGRCSNAGRPSTCSRGRDGGRASFGRKERRYFHPRPVRASRLSRAWRTCRRGCQARRSCSRCSMPSRPKGKLRTANVLLTRLEADVPLRSRTRHRPAKPVGHGQQARRRRPLGGARSRAFNRRGVASSPPLSRHLGCKARFVAGVWLILSTGVRVGELLGADLGRRGSRFRRPEVRR